MSGKDQEEDAIVCGVSLWRRLILHNGLHNWGWLCLQAR